MNEQLIVKNFGPIKDATVDFKRVTVFIGPTGGGKSTLAKLAATFKDVSNYIGGQIGFNNSLIIYNIDGFSSNQSEVYWHSIHMSARFYAGRWQTGAAGEMANAMTTIKKEIDAYGEELDRLQNLINSESINQEEILERVRELLHIREDKRSFYKSAIAPNKPNYFPAERIALSILDAAWPDLVREKANIPITLLNFAKQYLQSKERVRELIIPMLNVTYRNQSDKDIIILPGGSHLSLTAAASGIQSVIPLLVLLEHLSYDTEQVQSFIIEEPELNLYPTAQQGLLNWLVEKCTKGENDLTITTHSPYLLAHFNTLLFAYQVAQNHPERADEIAKVVPRESWINPAEFAAYHVEGQQENGVRSIVNPETGLISYNGLDAIASAEASEFEKLLDINAGLSVEW